MRREHFRVVGLAVAFGLVAIIFFGYATKEMLARRPKERYDANHDALTSLSNRRAMLTELERMQQWIVVAFIDLDEFKAIDDTYGHEVGASS